MVESDSNPDNQDLAQSLKTIAVGLANLKRLIDESPQVRQLRSDFLQLARQAQDAIAAVRVDPKVVEFLARLPEWHANFVANKALLDRGMANLKASPYRAVLHLFSLADVLPFAELTQQEIEENLFEHTASEPFVQELVQLYECTDLRPERLPLLREALALHGLRRFGGSTTLLYSQIEGIVGDALVHLGKARRGSDGVLTSITGKPKLNGLEPKLKLARDDVDDSIYEELLGECLVADSLDVRFSASRNGVLHGSDLSFATRDRSTQLVLWLAALLVSMRYDARMKRTVCDAAVDRNGHG